MEMLLVGSVWLKISKLPSTRVFGNIFKNKRTIEGRLNGIHRQLDIFPYSSLINLEKELQAEYSNIFGPRRDVVVPKI